MAVISIVGTSGVGKSFLVQQLASMECAPAFFEGEEGVIPDDILEDVFSGGSPVKRWVWFLERYRLALERVRKISDSGIDCFVDGAVMSSDAILVDEDKKYHDELLKLVEPLRHLEADRIVIITASREKIKELIESRCRGSEADEKALSRALRIQDEFIRLAGKYKDSIMIDRTDLDFAKYDDMKEVLKKIKG